MNTLFSPDDVARFFIGGDYLNDLLGKTARLQNDGYPPYNILKTSNDEFLVEIAIAGFSDDEVSIVVEQNKLRISGETKKDEADKDRQFMHRGIARRNFVRTFTLAEHIKVVNAVLSNGMLRVTLKRELPEAQKPVTIPIESR